MPINERNIVPLAVIGSFALIGVIALTTHIDIKFGDKSLNIKGKPFPSLPAQTKADWFLPGQGEQSTFNCK